MQKFRRLTFNLRVTVIFFFLVEMEFLRFQFSLYVMQSEFNINCVASHLFFLRRCACLIWRKNYDLNNAKEAGDPSILSEGQPSYGSQCC